jgi:two-component system, NarL family, nitrate/nitrite response regulator NarL
VNNSPLRVLIADDEPDVRLLLRLQLHTRADFEVVGEAADGNEAVEQCRDLTPDAVIMDLLMPKVNGFEAIATLQEEQPELGIVAYSAVAGDFVRQEMRRLGVELVLKSGDISPLTEALQRSANT